jgi:rubrerythrin
MASIHDPVLAAARRPGTRRGLVGGGALALAALAAAAAPGGRAALAQSRQAGGNGGGTGGGGDDGYTDLEVLNYALTLEHLEYAFYRDGLERFSARDFNRAGFGPPAYGRLKTIREHERIHVETLTDVITDLGGDPVEEAPCYAFADAFRSVESFLATAQLLENTGVMAYDGAIALIDAPELQTAGATIATVEARHAAYLNDLNGDSPFPAAFDEPKTPEQILAAAAPFFECDAGA